MKVYMITVSDDGDSYDSYRVCAVTLDREQAELLKAKYSDEWYEAYIDEYDTDDYKIEVGADYTPMWNVEFNDNINEIHRCYTIAHEGREHGQIYKYNVYQIYTTVFVEAKDEDHAKKIAKDIYMKWLAEQNNL